MVRILAQCSEDRMTWRHEAPPFSTCRRRSFPTSGLHLQQVEPFDVIGKAYTTYRQHQAERQGGRDSDHSQQPGISTTVAATRQPTRATRQPRQAI